MTPLEIEATLLNNKDAKFEFTFAGGIKRIGRLRRLQTDYVFGLDGYSKFLLVLKLEDGIEEYFDCDDAQQLEYISVLD